MLTVKGTYKDGHVELEEPVTIREPHPVLVTFLEGAREEPVNGAAEMQEYREALEGVIGLYDEMTPEQQRLFDEALQRRPPFFGPREVEW
jgi:hypothetical protein